LREKAIGLGLKAQLIFFSLFFFRGCLFYFLNLFMRFSLFFTKKKRKSAENRKKNKVKHYIPPACLPLKAGRLNAGGSLRSNVKLFNKKSHAFLPSLRFIRASALPTAKSQAARPPGLLEKWRSRDFAIAQSRFRESSIPRQSA